MFQCQEFYTFMNIAVLGLIRQPGGFFAGCGIIHPFVVMLDRVEAFPLPLGENRRGKIHFIAAAADQAVACHEPAHQHPMFPDRLLGIRRAVRVHRAFAETNCSKMIHGALIKMDDGINC